MSVVQVNDNAAGDFTAFLNRIKRISETVHHSTISDYTQAVHNVETIERVVGDIMISLRATLDNLNRAYKEKRDFSTFAAIKCIEEFKAYLNNFFYDMDAGLDNMLGDMK